MQDERVSVRVRRPLPDLHALVLLTDDGEARNELES